MLDQCFESFSSLFMVVYHINKVKVTFLLRRNYEHIQSLNKLKSRLEYYMINKNDVQGILL